MHARKSATVMMTLKMLFGRESQIVKALVDKTKSLPHVQERRPETIIKFANSINNLVATMTSLKQDGHMKNPSLMEELLSKLPPSLQLQWCLQKPQEESLKNFGDLMMKIATAAALMPISSFSDKPENNHQPRKQVLTTFNANSKDPKKCLRCNSKEHDALSECPKFLSDDVENCWNFVAAKRLCFSCLQHGHQAGSCPTRKNCGINGCTMPHNTLLHRNQIQGQTSPN